MGKVTVVLEKLTNLKDGTCAALGIEVVLVLGGAKRRLRPDIPFHANIHPSDHRAILLLGSHAY
jgi:hypothetical protein